MKKNNLFTLEFTNFKKSCLVWIRYLQALITINFRFKFYNKKVAIASQHLDNFSPFFSLINMSTMLCPKVWKNDCIICFVYFFVKEYNIKTHVYIAVVDMSQSSHSEACLITGDSVTVEAHLCSPLGHRSTDHHTPSPDFLKA